MLMGQFENFYKIYSDEDLSQKNDEKIFNL